MKLTLVTRLLLALCLTLLASSLSFSEANDHQLADNAIKRLIKSRSRSKNSPAALPRSFKKIINFNARKEYSPAVRSSIYQPQTGSMEHDKINALPGQPNGIGFNQYAGYVTVDAQAGRALTRIVNSDGKTLFQNEYAWNNVANVIFLESPAGVGFSYSNTTSDYDHAGDNSTAADSYTFLVNWLERFPQYKNRDFFITGESYAGHYVPQLADTIVSHNKVANQTIINLKGVAIGNGVLNDPTDEWGAVDFYWSHALISDESYKGIHTYCDFTSENSTEQCDKFLSQSSDEIGDIFGYNIYAPFCNGTGTQGNPSGSVNEFDPCSRDYVNTYLNSPQVQTALHVNPTKWSSCSGDIDGVVPITSTRYSISSLNLPIKTPWYPWYINANEVGGYVEGYEGLTFVTVRGAGHFVPSYQPKRALVMIASFLQGILPPSDLDKLIKSKRLKDCPLAELQADEKEYYSAANTYIKPQQNGLMQADKIKLLPGQSNGVDFDQYSGYVTVDPKSGRSLFYYFAESPQNSSTNPSLLWLDGGPGCSSLAYGAVTESGSFRMNKDGKTLFRNNYAWNNGDKTLRLGKRDILGIQRGWGFGTQVQLRTISLMVTNSMIKINIPFLIKWLERNTKECSDSRDEAADEIGDIDIYNICAPICISPTFGNGSLGSASLS
ncbi:hypothetical protein CUMW_129650 [Citrus unshiu]|nr:hypothetical protein CUMW_129650 [Citrus unshiu]